MPLSNHPNQNRFRFNRATSAESNGPSAPRPTLAPYPKNIYGKISDLVAALTLYNLGIWRLPP